MKKIVRGAIFYADLDLGIGSEQRGFRPVIVLQNNVGNNYSPTTMIAPITTKRYKGKRQPTHVGIKQLRKLRPNSIILLEQIRTVDKSRLKGFICMLNEKEMEDVDKAICISLGLK